MIMHFELKHTFDASIDQVVEAMFDPTLADYLKSHMKLIRDVRPMERKEEGNLVRRKVRYVPVPFIESVGPKKIPPETLAFVEESTFDRAAKKVTFKNIGEHERVRKHLENGGTISFRDLGNGKTERTIEGELKVTNLPFLLRPLGAIAERIIRSNAENLLNEEAKVFGEFVKQRTAAPASA
jgi:hypothetical protein